MAGEHEERIITANKLLLETMTVRMKKWWIPYFIPFAKRYINPWIKGRGNRDKKTLVWDRAVLLLAMKLLNKEGEGLNETSGALNVTSGILNETNNLRKKQYHSPSVHKQFDSRRSCPTSEFGSSSKTPTVSERRRQSLNRLWMLNNFVIK